jgi:hypothetical protein
MMPLLLLMQWLVGGAAQTQSECLTCTANAQVTGGVYCISTASKCTNSSTLCAQPQSSCATAQCCSAYFTQPDYCSFYHNTGTCQKQTNCALDWVRSTEGATGCAQLAADFRCCVKRPVGCTFRGNTGICTKQVYCNLAWVSQSTGAVGCENEPLDVRCCAQNTPKPTPFVPGPTSVPPVIPAPPAVVTSAPTTTAAPPTVPTTTALQIFTTGNKVADCTAVYRCPGGVCILDRQCACRLPAIQHPVLGCTQDEAISTQCRGRPCDSDPAAPYCAVFGDDAFCFAANGTFVPRARVEPTTTTLASVPQSGTDGGATTPTEGGFPLAAIIAIVVVVVVLALIAGVVGGVCVARKRRQNQIREQQQHFHGSTAAPAAKSHNSRSGKKGADDGNAIVMTTAAQNYAETTVAAGGASQATDYASMPGTSTTTTLKGPYMSDAAYIGDVKREQPLF